MNFVVKGIISKKEGQQRFVKKLVAKNEKSAREKIFAELGGKNKLKRRNIIINEVKVENNE